MGKRAFQLHLQGVLEIRYPTTKVFQLKLGKLIKALMPRKGVGHKVNIKPLGKGQTKAAMIGYITKDGGESHYEVLVHNISAQVLRTLFTTIDFLTLVFGCRNLLVAAVSTSHFSLATTIISECLQ